MPLSPPVLWHTWVFGRDDYHAEAMAMLLSAVARRSERSRLRVHTDRPEWYAWMKPMVEVEAMSEAQVAQWAGQPRYLPRVKAKLIEKTAAEFPGHTVWLDTDMWAVAPLAELEAQLDAGRPLMYLRENKISKGVTATERKYRAYFKAKAPAQVPDLYQWNSGVLGLPAGWSGRAGEAVAMLDDMTAQGILDFTREQMAFSSVLLGAGGLGEAQEQFRHYWGPSKRALWQPLLKQVVFKVAVHQREPEVILDWIRSLPESAIPTQRQPWIERKKRSLRKRLGLLAPNE